MGKNEIDKAYEQGIPVVTDEQYDLEFGINATSEYSGEASFWNKKKHLDQFGGASLNKVPVFQNDQFDQSELKNWISKFEDDQFCCSLKYDGISIDLIYEDGYLNHAITKGVNGVGEDILRNVLKMQNVRENITLFEKRVVSLKAEIVMEHDVYNLAKSKGLLGDYKNPRNGAAGAAKAHDGAFASNLSLRYYGANVIVGDSLWQTESDKFSVLFDVGFDELRCFTASGIEDVVRFYNNIMQERMFMNVDIDGIVVCANNMKIQVRHTSEKDDRVKYAVALKFPYLEKETFVCHIVWQNGAKGRITPVAEIFPIELGGATISRVTLKNVDEMKRLKIKEGDRIVVSRRGDVIPNIEKNLSGLSRVDYTVDIPQFCPTCGKPTTHSSPYLFCKNEECRASALGDIVCWIDMMKLCYNYRGMGHQRVKQIFERGLINDACDLFTLSASSLMELDGIASDTAQNILNIQKCNRMPLSVFLAALNMENVGYETAKSISKKFDIEILLNLSSWTSLLSLEGVAESKAISIMEGMRKKRDFIVKMLRHVEIIEEEHQASYVLKGKTFCVTGTLCLPRETVKQKVERNGGKVVGGVSAITNYLILGSKAGASKSRDADKYGTKIISEDEFDLMISE